MQDAPYISIDDDEPSLHHSTMLAPSAINTNQPGSASANLQPDVATAFIRRAALPPFLKEEPDIWFIIAEAEFFATNTSSDNVKFVETLRALDKDTMKQIKDFFRNQPTENKYLA
ncbi:hypothetical protein PV327_008763 [Microctonus hyperodae]|uniref:DUF7041 domain-containing protein n=1 Tax=Microctonus hyperodae TaxID=165561 RepID=A0AA39FSE4_MICHY|nr:hypothetical protein PV327_008763 [Microctonus hyperodae]